MEPIAVVILSISGKESCCVCFRCKNYNWRLCTDGEPSFAKMVGWLPTVLKLDAHSASSGISQIFSLHDTVYVSKATDKITVVMLFVYDVDYCLHWLFPH